ncbi:MAG: sulfite exporter TauE/SafE family protein [Sandaracinaceae bacterium]|nr:sulfite exporter TauE/SafE family protein [Sandaracinaceae bacterium]
MPSDALPYGSLAFLALVVLVASAVNTVAGAGSLLVLPALIFSGLDASSANATNRIGILVQTAAAIVGFRRAGKTIGRHELHLTLTTMLGGLLGSFLATLLAPSQMQLAIVIAMGLVLFLTLLPKAARPPDAPPPADSLPAPTPTMLAGFFAIGVYGGFLQAGVGILVLLFLSRVFDTSLVASNVLKSTATFGLTLVALAMFAARGETIDLPRGLVLALGAALGGYFGADLAVRLGERWTRRAIVVAVLASMAKLVFDLTH